VTLVGKHWAVALTCFQIGCAAVVEFPDDPELIDQGPWRCLTEPVERAAPTRSTAHVQLQVCDSLRGCSLPISGLSARLCGKLDAGCTSPISANISYAEGVFDFDVPTGSAGFDGYLEVSAPSELCTNREVFGEASAAVCALLAQCDPKSPDARCSVLSYPRALQFFNPPIVADTVSPRPIYMSSAEASRAIGQAAGTDFDPTKGSLIVTAVDCDGKGAPGVAFAMSGQQRAVGQLFYMQNGIPSVTLQETDATGFGGFVGMPAGYLDVVAKSSTGTRIGGVAAYVAAASTTFITLVPAP
jgi:hypothetical protein